jgi:hypothetical protein
MRSAVKKKLAGLSALLAFLVLTGCGAQPRPDNIAIVGSPFSSFILFESAPDVTDRLYDDFLATRFEPSGQAYDAFHGYIVSFTRNGGLVAWFAVDENGTFLFGSGSSSDVPETDRSYMMILPPEGAETYRVAVGLLDYAAVDKIFRAPQSGGALPDREKADEGGDTPPETISP